LLHGPDFRFGLFDNQTHKSIGILTSADVIVANCLGKYKSSYFSIKNPKLKHLKSTKRVRHGITDWRGIVTEYPLATATKRLQLVEFGNYPVAGFVENLGIGERQDEIAHVGHVDLHDIRRNFYIKIYILFRKIIFPKFYLVEPAELQVPMQLKAGN